MNKRDEGRRRFVEDAIAPRTGSHWRPLSRELHDLLFSALAVIRLALVALLAGVAVQKSLVLLSQTKELTASGVPFREALREASLGRVRPKLMTAGASILGLAPMLFGFGGSELERPLAVVMVGGLVTSTLFTLLVLPAVYARVGDAATRSGTGDGGHPDPRDGSA